MENKERIELYDIATAPLGKVVEIAESFVNTFGVTSDIEVSIVIKNIDNSGRGIPFSKWCNSRNYNQQTTYQLLKDQNFITGNKQVTSECVLLLDEGRTDVEYYNDLTLYNTPDGRLFINTKSPRIARITGELVGLEEGYNSNFREAESIDNKKILSQIDGIRSSLFPNIKSSYRPTTESVAKREAKQDSDGKD